RTSEGRGRLLSPSFSGGGGAQRNARGSWSPGSMDLSTSRSSFTRALRDPYALTVAVRMRPFLSNEGNKRVVVGRDGGSLTLVNPKVFKASADAVIATAAIVSQANMATFDWLRSFQFDRIFGATKGSRPGTAEGGGKKLLDVAGAQEKLYKELGEPIVEHALKGNHCSFFAYGHTGSGKTYSVFGPKLEDPALVLGDPPVGEGYGLAPRVCFEVLRRVKELQARADQSNKSTAGPQVKLQYFEVYNDKIRDLLNPSVDPRVYRVREDPRSGPFVENLFTPEVKTWSHIQRLLAAGCCSRSQAETAENRSSSRGHAILTLEVSTEEGTSRVQLVDLAGSEREVNVGGEAYGGSYQGDKFGGPLRLRESAMIKKTLTNLGLIINSLSRGDNAVGLPFRESILTWLLKEALCGRARTTMLATVSPSSEAYLETLSTLTYAERLRK
ncbi:unnamed protein product, partial [Choristocarpus tenellus]